MEDEINIRDYLEVILKWKSLILAVVLIATFIVVFPNLSKKDNYEAKSALLLKDSGNGSTAQASGLQTLLGIKTGSSINQSFTILLNSKAVASNVLDDMKLTQRIKGWDAPDAERQELITAVRSMVRFAEKDGLFEVVAVTEDPKLSADLANAYANYGAEYWRKLNYSEARKKREYIESQLPRVEGDLRRAENALKKFALISPDALSLQGVDFERLKREYDIQSSTYLLLRKEYETAKLDESKDLEPFSVIDPAEVPLKPLRSKIVLFTAIGLIFGLFSGTFLAFFLEYWKKIT